ncbi:MAG: prealbumin-like fold domain-containing protein [Bifidobacterium animalis]|nr:prealbumin-like fold domain-containing protein [Bifidobacterium animalis]MDY5040401.1 prealbumin-like fold domain-containing protein [Bifidobacterium animalis]
MKRNWLRKAAAALVSVATVAAVGIGLSAPAYADDASTTTAPQITVLAPSGDNSTLGDVKANFFENRDFKAFKLAGYSNVKVNTQDQVTNIGYNVVNGLNNDEIDRWIAAGYNAGSDAEKNNLSSVIEVTGDKVTFKGDAQAMDPITFVANYFYGTGGDKYGNTQVSDTMMRVFAEAAEQYYKGQPSQATFDKNSDSMTVKCNEGEGLYLIIDVTTGLNTQIPARAMVTGTPVTVNGKTYTKFHGEHATYTLGEIHLKAEQVVTSLAVVNTQADEYGQSENQFKGTPVAIGSQRVFQTTANIPNYGDYEYWQDPRFRITLAPSANISLDNAKLNVEVQPLGGQYAKADAQNYTATPNQDGSIVIDFQNLKTAAMSGATVRVTVTGTVNNLTEAASQVTSKTQFSNDPANGTQLSSSPISKTVGLFDADIPMKKIAWEGNAQSDALEGAQFSITPANGSALKFTKGTDKKGNTVFQVNPKGDLTAVEIGAARVAGLLENSKGAVTYTVKETKAPNGYVLDGRHDIEFTVTLTPDISADNALNNITFKRDDGLYGNFLTESSTEMVNGNGQRVDTPTRNAGGTYDTTHMISGQIVIKNTKNPSDFAQTGGTITKVLIAMLIIAIVGAVLLLIARQRRRSGAKTA